MRRVVVLVGLAALVVGAVLDRRGLGAWDLGSDLDRLTAGAAAILVVAGLLSLADGRAVRLIAAVLGTGAAVASGIAAARAVATGLPGPSTGVLVAASAVVLGGVVARAVGPRRARVRRGRVAVVAVAAGVVTALMAGTAAAAVAHVPVRSTTAPDAVPAPVGDGATAVRWTWPGDGPVRDVRAAGAGVVVAGADGVTALDGTTGAVRWSFARVGARLTGMLVSPDRRVVTVAHTADPAPVTVLTVLDATTGAPRWETATARTPVPVLTDAVLAVDEMVDAPSDGSRRSRTTARDLGSGAVLWTWEPPAGCTSELLYPAAVTTVVPVETACPDGVVVHGLGERTGTDVWTLPTVESYAYASPLRATADGTRLLVDGPDGRLVVDAAGGTRLVAVPSRDGFLRPSGEGWIPVSGDDPERVVAAVDPVSGALAPVPAGCADEVTATVTDRGVLRLCRTGTALAVQADGGVPVPLDLRRGDRFGGLDLLRDAFVVPAPGAVVVGVVGDDRVVGLG